ncbi:MAG: helix-turn-helix transcriptional regulator [Parcubacteria group bacterium]
METNRINNAHVLRRASIRALDFPQTVYIMLPVKTVGQVIREEREKRKWSQMKLAVAAGVHMQTIGYIERGDVVAEVETLRKIDAVLPILSRMEEEGIAREPRKRTPPG